MKNIFENSGAAFGLTLFILGAVVIFLALARFYEAFYLFNVLFWVYFVVSFFAVALDEYENEDINTNNIW